MHIYKFPINFYTQRLMQTAIYKNVIIDILAGMIDKLCYICLSSNDVLLRVFSFAMLCHLTFSVYKKQSPNARLTLYLSTREFVHFGDGKASVNYQLL